MSNLSTSAMKRAIESILKSHRLLERFEEGRSFHAKIHSDGFMPLTIERHDRQVIVAHYFEQNGDLVPDPDMEIEIGADGAWYPVAMQFAIGAYRRCLDDEGRINLRERRNQVSYASMWARNLKWQGFVDGTVLAASAETT